MCLEVIENKNKNMVREGLENRMGWFPHGDLLKHGRAEDREYLFKMVQGLGYKKTVHQLPYGKKKEKHLMGYSQTHVLRDYIWRRGEVTELSPMLYVGYNTWDHGWIDAFKTNSGEGDD